MSNRAELIHALRHYPEKLTALVRGLTPEQLTTAYNAPEWTIAQNVHHVADSHMNSFIRFRLILTEDKPTLRPYDQDAWSQIPEAQSADIEPSLMILRGLHTRWANMLETVTDWSREGLHPADGAVTLDSLLVSYVNHGEGHLTQIREVMAKMPA